MTKFRSPIIPKPFPQEHLASAKRVADNGTVALWRIGEIDALNRDTYFCPDSTRLDAETNKTFKSKKARHSAANLRKYAGTCIHCDEQHGHVWVICNAQGIVLDSFRGYHFQLPEKFSKLYGWQEPTKKKAKKKDTRTVISNVEISKRMLWQPSATLSAEMDKARTTLAAGEAKRREAREKAKAKR